MLGKCLVAATVVACHTFFAFYPTCQSFSSRLLPQEWQVANNLAATKTVACHTCGTKAKESVEANQTCPKQNVLGLGGVCLSGLSYRICLNHKQNEEVDENRDKRSEARQFLACSLRRLCFYDPAIS